MVSNTLQVFDFPTAVPAFAGTADCSMTPELPHSIALLHPKFPESREFFAISRVS